MKNKLRLFITSLMLLYFSLISNTSLLAQTIEQIKIPSPKIANEMPSGYQEGKFALSPDKNYLISYDIGWGRYSIWHLPDGKLILNSATPVDGNSILDYLTFSEDGKYVRGINDKDIIHNLSDGTMSKIEPTNTHLAKLKWFTLNNE